MRGVYLDTEQVIIDIAWWFLVQLSLGFLRLRA